MTDIAGRRALITGAASGLGKQIALRLAEKGARVVGWDIDEPRLDALRGELARHGDGHATYRCDVTRREEVYATAEQVRAQVGPVDILVNNAGVVSGTRFLDVTDAQVERTMAVNTMALFWTTRAFLPAMIGKGSGHLVTIASAAGLIGVSGLADYCASKFAAVGFDEAMRVELKRVAPGVRTTVVCPYFIDTGMFAGVRTRFSWLLPILKEGKVARAVVRAIQRNRRRVVTPPLVYLVPPLRLLPVGVFDAIASLLGINAAMDHFTGRSSGAGARPRGPAGS
jgi:all-trans-retinol dehydrogenase (NAD+)